MRKRLLATVLALALGLGVCGCHKEETRFSAQYWDAFDTQITITGYAESRSAFDEASEQAHRELIRLHALFDRYQEHEGVNGVYELNRTGALKGAPEELIELLQFCGGLYEKAHRRVNPAMGRLLKLWSDYREAGAALPPMDLLRDAARGMSPEHIHIDAEKRTIALDPGTQVDLGAVAKGYAVERVARLLESTMPSFLIDAGGNIRVGQPPPDRAHWTIGIYDPSGVEEGQSGILTKIEAADLSVVSSGGYQRFYEVDGVRYHHIIDPDTLMPGGDFLQTTVLARDSALADYLSTALFLLPYDKGRALIESMDSVDAVWVLQDKAILMTSGAARLADGA